MPFYRIGNAMVHIKLGGKKKRPLAACVARIQIEKRECRCMAISTIQCDWENEDGHTCDAPLCADHAHEIGPDKHLCDMHYAQHRAAQPELFE